MAKTVVKEKEKTEERQGGILWTDPVTDRWGTTAYSTCVVDGLMFRVSPSGRTYCAGPYKPPTPEKGVAGPSPDRHQTQRSGVKEPVPKIDKGKKGYVKPSKAKTPIFGTPQNASKRGRPKKTRNEGKLLKMSHTMTIRQIVKKTGVPRSTVQRILAGQKVLV